MLFFFFVSTVHQNYVGIDTDKNPYFLSIVSQDSGNKCVPLYRAMLFRKQVRMPFLFTCFYQAISGVPFWSYPGPYERRGKPAASQKYIPYFHYTLYRSDDGAQIGKYRA